MNSCWCFSMTRSLTCGGSKRLSLRCSLPLIASADSSEPRRSELLRSKRSRALVLPPLRASWSAASSLNGNWPFGGSGLRSSSAISNVSSFSGESDASREAALCRLCRPYDVPPSGPDPLLGDGPASFGAPLVFSSSTVPVFPPSLFSFTSLPLSPAKRTCFGVISSVILRSLTVRGFCWLNEVWVRPGNLFSVPIYLIDIYWPIFLSGSLPSEFYD